MNNYLNLCMCVQMRVVVKEHALKGVIDNLYKNAFLSQQVEGLMYKINVGRRGSNSILKSYGSSAGIQT